jgi:hypothetical protein
MISEPWTERWKVENNDRILDIDGDFGPIRVLIKNDERGAQRNSRGQRRAYGSGFHHRRRGTEEDEPISETSEAMDAFQGESRRRRRPGDSRYPMNERARPRNKMEDRIFRLERQVGSLSALFANQGRYSTDRRGFPQRRSGAGPERRRNVWSSDSDDELIKPRRARQPRRPNAELDEFEGFSDDLPGR